MSTVRFERLTPRATARTFDLLAGRAGNLQNRTAKILFERLMAPVLFHSINHPQAAELKCSFQKMLTNTELFHHFFRKFADRFCQQADNFDKLSVYEQNEVIDTAKHLAWIQDLDLNDPLFLKTFEATQRFCAAGPRASHPVVHDSPQLPVAVLESRKAGLESKLVRIQSFKPGGTQRRSQELSIISNFIYLGDFKRAIEIIEGSSLSPGTKSDFLIQIAEIHFRKGNAEEAIRLLNDVIRQYREIAHLGSWVLVKAGHLDLARSEIDAVFTPGTKAACLISFASICLETGSVSESLTALTDSIDLLHSLSPRDRSGNLSNSPQMVDILLKTIGSLPQSKEVEILLARISDFIEILSNSPNKSRWFLQITKIYLRIGDTGKALGILEKLEKRSRQELESRKINFEYLIALAEILASLNETEEAAKIAASLMNNYGEYLSRDRRISIRLIALMISIDPHILSEQRSQLMAMHKESRSQEEIVTGLGSKDAGICYDALGAYFNLQFRDPRVDRILLELLPAGQNLSFEQIIGLLKACHLKSSRENFHVNLAQLNINLSEIEKETDSILSWPERYCLIRGADLTRLILNLRSLKDKLGEDNYCGFLRGVVESAGEWAYYALKESMGAFDSNLSPDRILKIVRQVKSQSSNFWDFENILNVTIADIRTREDFDFYQAHHSDLNLAQRLKLYHHWLAKKGLSVSQQEVLRSIRNDFLSFLMLDPVHDFGRKALRLILSAKGAREEFDRAFSKYLVGELVSKPDEPNPSFLNDAAVKRCSALKRKINSLGLRNCQGIIAFLEYIDAFSANSGKYATLIEMRDELEVFARKFIDDYPAFTEGELRRFLEKAFLLLVKKAFEQICLKISNTILRNLGYGTISVDIDPEKAKVWGMIYLRGFSGAADSTSNLGISLQIQQTLQLELSVSLSLEDFMIIGGSYSIPDFLDRLLVLNFLVHHELGHAVEHHQLLNISSNTPEFNNPKYFELGSLQHQGHEVVIDMVGLNLARGIYAFNLGVSYEANPIRLKEAALSLNQLAKMILASHQEDQSWDIAFLRMAAVCRELAGYPDLLQIDQNASYDLSLISAQLEAFVKKRENNEERSREIEAIIEYFRSISRSVKIEKIRKSATHLAEEPD